MEENQLAKYRQGNGDIVNITGLKQYSISDDHHRHQTQELHLRNMAMHWHTLERVSFVLGFFRFSKKENKCSINMAKTMALLVVILRQCKYESMNILPVWLLLSGGSARRTNRCMGWQLYVQGNDTHWNVTPQLVSCYRFTLLTYNCCIPTFWAGSLQHFGVCVLATPRNVQTFEIW